MLIGELKQKIKDDIGSIASKAVEDLTNHFQQMQKEAQEAGSKAAADATKEPGGATAGSTERSNSTSSSNNSDVVDAEIV
ncbi:MAG: hypothetical protein IPJ49_30745 [Candidatus Obscuribacter sp.]|nr:hypothetical protein [Candidatus Obscuribacter sp.]